NGNLDGADGNLDAAEWKFDFENMAGYFGQRKIDFGERNFDLREGLTLTCRRPRPLPPLNLCAGRGSVIPRGLTMPAAFLTRCEAGRRATAVPQLVHRDARI